MSEEYYVRIEKNNPDKLKVLNALVDTGCKIKAYSTEQPKEKITDSEVIKKIVNEEKLRSLYVEYDNLEVSVIFNNDSVDLMVNRLFTENRDEGIPKTVRQTFDKLIRIIQSVIETGTISEFIHAGKFKSFEYVFGEPNFKGFYERNDMYWG